MLSQRRLDGDLKLNLGVHKNFAENCLRPKPFAGPLALEEEPEGFGREPIIAAVEKSKVILRAVTPQTLNRVVRECMEFCEWQRWIPRDGIVVVKPNLCTAVPELIEASNTKLALTAAVCEVLLERTNRISFVEADHMRQKTEDVFDATGYREIEKKYGVALLNLSKLPTVNYRCDPVGEIPLPRMLFECDTFISVPVLKTHALTYFTGVLKNQWGCVPGYLERLQHHGAIHELLSTLHRILQPKFSIMDGIVGMEGRGPVAGKARRLDVILASQDAVALDATSMRLVGLEPTLSKHVVIAAKQGLGRISSEEIEIDGAWEAHATQFEPPPKDRLNTLMFKFSRYRWFTQHILRNDAVYYPVRFLVKLLRRLGIVSGL